jgi:pimeloyl-ACP methyl ester carboxylesterase
VRFAYRAVGALVALPLASTGAWWPEGDPVRAPVPERRPSSTTAAWTGQDLEWRPCPGGECAELAVPRDYDKPKGRTIDVALFRVAARQPDQRIGSLLVNPGGPGASGVEFARARAAAFPGALRDRFDIVGFDPRGAGETIPVDCVDSLDPLLDLDYSPDSSNERALLRAAGRDFAAACETRSGDVLPYVASRDTVRDMDRIRAALSDERLTYLGASYGTYLGALYAELFPKRVRALVLDGAVDPSLDAAALRKEQAVGFERALEAFLDECAADASCEFHGGGDPHRAYDVLTADVNAAPVPAPDGRTLGPNEFDVGVAAALYLGEDGYGALAGALAAAARGDGGGLLGLYDAYSERERDGTYSNTLEAYFAISCLDVRPIPARAYRRLEVEFRAAAPRVGAALLYELVMCAYWPAPPAPSPGPIRGEGAAPILVVGTTGDPATPYQSARSLAEQLDSAVLLTVEGQQHVAFLRNGCATEKAVGYLVDLEVPRRGTRCER